MHMEWETPIPHGVHMIVLTAIGHCNLGQFVQITGLQVEIRAFDSRLSDSGHIFPNSTGATTFGHITFFRIKILDHSDSKHYFLDCHW